MKNIVLIGMMGSGKSSVGKQLSEKLDRPFIDTDEIIEKREERTITEIFELYGENYFRKLEMEIVKEVAEYDNHIISTGGGIVVNPDNVSRLKMTGQIFYLKNDIDELAERLSSNTENRPLLEDNNLHRKLKQILSKRETLYLQSADEIIENKDLDHTVSQIVTLSKKK
jgi:shikimate kinase